MSETEKSQYRIQSVLNFRDVGGVPVQGGRVIRTGIIYRSANPDKISRNDADKMRNLGIKTIIDLRAEHEVKKKRRMIEGSEIISMPLDFELKTREKLMPLLRQKNSEAKIEEISHELYLEMIDFFGPVLKNILEIILFPGKQPVLIHCQAGKDRTGIISALIQMLLGADRKIIIDDYMRSNDELLPYFRKMLLIRRILSFGFFPADKVLIAITTRERNIKSVLERVENHHRGIVEYLASAGFDTSRIKDLHEMLTEQIT